MQAEQVRPRGREDGRQAADDGLRLPWDLREQKRRQDAAGGAAAYPYDPSVRSELLVGLDKLRAIRDRGEASELYELYWIAERNSRDPELRRRDERIAAQRAEERADYLAALAERALRGDFGPVAQREAREVMVDQYGEGRTDLRSLEECERRIRQTRER